MPKYIYIYIYSTKTIHEMILVSLSPISIHKKLLWRIYVFVNSWVYDTKVELPTCNVIKTHVADQLLLMFESHWNGVYLPIVQSTPKIYFFKKWWQFKLQFTDTYLWDNVTTNSLIANKVTFHIYLNLSGSTIWCILLQARFPFHYRAPNYLLICFECC